MKKTRIKALLLFMYTGLSTPVAGLAQQGRVTLHEDHDGLMLDVEWVADTDYSDPRVIELLLREVTELAGEFRNTRGLLLYLLGNENNYGLFWAGAETEDQLCQAYYVLKGVHAFDPYAPDATPRELIEYFDGISLIDAYKRATGRLPREDFYGIMENESGVNGP